MKVIIKVDDEDSMEEVDATFTNEFLNNNNFVEMFVGEKSFTFSVEELYRVAKLFNEHRNENRDY